MITKAEGAGFHRDGGPINNVASIEGEIIRLLHRDAARAELADLQPHVHAMPEGPQKTALAQSLAMGLSVKDRLAQHQQRERGLMAVIETAQDLTGITDTDSVLQAIVRRARALLGCGVGYLSIYDAQNKDFYVRATDGAFSERFRRIRIGLNTGVCGYVARHRSPYSSSDYAGDDRFNHSRFIDAAMGDENIESILGVPLLAGNEVSGVLFVGDRYVRTYSAWEKSILSTLGAQASLAIDNARLFEQAQAALDKAGKTNDLLLRQTADTRAAAQAHEQLTTLVARGGTLQDLCAMLVRRLGGLIVVCDERGKEILSAGEDTPEVAHEDHWVDDPVYAALSESRRTGLSVARQDGISGQGEGVMAKGRVRTKRFPCCRVCAVVGGEGLLGGLILHTMEPLNDVAVRILERGAIVTAVVLLLKAQRETSLMSDAPAVLRSLLHAPHRSVERVTRQAARYGVDIHQPMRLMLISTERPDSASLSRHLMDRLGASTALFDEVGDRLVVLANEAKMPLMRTAVLACLHGYRGRFSGVISGVMLQPDQLASTFDIAERCLALLDVLNRHGQIYETHQLALYAPIFHRADGAAIEDFLVTTLGGLYVASDDAQTRHIELARTLLAYLDHGRNAAQTARYMSLHINTLRQRLDSIDAVLASWRDAGRALEVHMALRLWRLRDSQLFPQSD